MGQNIEIWNCWERNFLCSIGGNTSRFLQTDFCCQRWFWPRAAEQLALMGLPGADADGVRWPKRHFYSGWYTLRPAKFCRQVPLFCKRRDGHVSRESITVETMELGSISPHGCAVCGAKKGWVRGRLTQNLEVHACSHLKPQIHNKSSEPEPAAYRCFPSSYRMTTRLSKNGVILAPQYDFFEAQRWCLGIWRAFQHGHRALFF